MSLLQKLRDVFRRSPPSPEDVEAAAESQRLRDETRDDAPGSAMGFLEHLDELRRRLIRSCIAVAAGMCAAFFFVDRLGDFILAPTLRALPRGEALILTKPGEGFVMSSATVTPSSPGPSTTYCAPSAPR